jgi:outer membrane biosynthesis protein TonB
MNRLAFLVPLLLLGCTQTEPVPKQTPVTLLTVLPEHSAKRRVVYQPRTPPYPQKARNAGVQGETLVGLVVGNDGVVSELVPYSGDPLLLAHTVEFANAVKFEPNNPTSRERPVVLKIRYRLEGGAGLIEIIFGTNLGA